MNNRTSLLHEAIGRTRHRLHPDLETWIDSVNKLLVSTSQQNADPNVSLPYMPEQYVIPTPTRLIKLFTELKIESSIYSAASPKKNQNFLLKTKLETLARELNHFKTYNLVLIKALSGDTERLNNILWIIDQLQPLLSEDSEKFKTLIQFKNMLVFLSVFELEKLSNDQIVMAEFGSIEREKLQTLVELCSDLSVISEADDDQQKYSWPKFYFKWLDPRSREVRLNAVFRDLSERARYLLGNSEQLNDELSELGGIDEVEKISSYTVTPLEKRWLLLKNKNGRINYLSKTLFANAQDRKIKAVLKYFRRKANSADRPDKKLKSISNFINGVLVSEVPFTTFIGPGFEEHFAYLEYELSILPTERSIFRKAPEINQPAAVKTQIAGTRGT